jgi:hypothetical protein
MSKIPRNGERVLVDLSRGTPPFRRPDRVGADGKGAHLEGPTRVRWSKFWTARLLAGEVEVATEGEG